MNLSYSINEVSFASMGIHVAKSPGVMDGLQLKDPYQVDWPDANGQVLDLSRPRFESREIKLDCFMVASSADNFITQENRLITELVRRNTQRLKLTPVTGKPLVFEVYCKGGFEMEKSWRDTTMIGKFTLTLIEPQPVKWVLIGSGNSDVSVTLSADSPIKLHWGDGSVSELLGGVQTRTHHYGGTSDAVYYLIIAGDLSRMTEHSKTNLTTLWPRLY